MMKLEYKGYVGSVEVDEDGLSGTVANARDTIHYAADTVPELRKAFVESVEDYLAFCRERGETPEKPFSGKFVVRVGRDLHRDLAAKAIAKKVSLNAFVVESLEEAVHKK